MAKKQKPAAPIDEPPSASSDKDQTPSHEEAAEEDEESDASSDEQEHVVPQPPSKNSHPKPASSDSDSDSDSESDTPTLTNSKVKPLASKPIDHTPKSKSSKPSTKEKPAPKRPAKSNGPSNDAKRAKKGGKEKEATNAAPDDNEDEVEEEAEEEDVKKAVGESRKLSHRLWSEDDEIAILKGIVEFTANTGQDPYRNADAFYDFVKKSLHAEASSYQLKEKIRRLKRKFENNAQRGKNGEDPDFAKPIEREAFELSKKVWGNGAAGGANGGVEKVGNARSSERRVGKSPKKEARSTVVVATPKPKLVKSEGRSIDSKRNVKVDADGETDTADTASYILEVIRGSKGIGLYGINENVLKRGMELIEASERKEFEEQWKELQDAEMELSVKRLVLVANHVRSAVEAYKSNH